ncbi:MAG: LLM class flavin-dependent oxidoreductase [Actinomycetota bacterium]|nr:LLM class flavin-dependent oxidoreductase [Actinomycetota bacterium]
MKLLVNWLPRDRRRTADVARAAEAAGFWGMGVCDSPRADELYASIGAALDATTTLRVGSCVTNPVTRHVSVHRSAVRTLGRTGRFFCGVGSGDSAVRDVGLRPARLAELDTFLGEMTDTARAAACPVLVAAGGPRTAELAGHHGAGIVAGSGADPVALGALVDAARAAQADPSGGDAPTECWVSLRLAVTSTDAELAEARRAFLPRAISASRFNFARGFAAKHVPEAFHDVLRERYRRYDFAHHGAAGANPNATLLADRPDIEDYLLDRFALIGPADRCRARLADLAAAGATGAVLSVRFEDVFTAIDAAGALNAAPAGGRTS